MRQRTVVNVHPAELGAARKGGHRLAGIEETLRVERLLDAEKTLERLGRELGTHAADLLDPDAMLAGDRAAHVDAQLEDAIAEFDRALAIARLVRVEQDQRMQVAVACVEYVRAGQPVLA